MEFIDNKTIKLGRILNDLDKLVLEFIKILEKHTDYVIISGYVAILLGRSRATDDVDIFIPKIDRKKFSELYHEFLQNGFWCLNTSEENEILEMLESHHGVRFAREPEVTPNFEIKLAITFYDTISLKNPITVITSGGNLRISFLELQIAYKEEILKSNKDLEDAKYLRTVAEGHLDESSISEYKKELRREWQKKP